MCVCPCLLRAKWCVPACERGKSPPFGVVCPRVYPAQPRAPCEVVCPRRKSASLAGVPDRDVTTSVRSVSARTRVSPMCVCPCLFACLLRAKWCVPACDCGKSPPCEVVCHRVYPHPAKWCVPGFTRRSLGLPAKWCVPVGNPRRRRGRLEKSTCFEGPRGCWKAGAACRCSLIGSMGYLLNRLSRQAVQSA